MRIKFYVIIGKQFFDDCITSCRLWYRIRKKLIKQCSPKMYKIPNESIWSLFENMKQEEVLRLCQKCGLEDKEVEQVLLFSGYSGSKSLTTGK